MKYLFFCICCLIGILTQGQSDSTKYLLISRGTVLNGVSEIHRVNHWYRVIGDTLTSKGKLIILDTAHFAVITKTRDTVKFRVDQKRIYTVNKTERISSIVFVSGSALIFAYGAYLLIPEIGPSTSNVSGLSLFLVSLVTVGSGASPLSIGMLDLFQRVYGTDIFGKKMEIIEVPIGLSENRIAVWNYLRKAKKGKI